jgi:competence protein ComEC
MDPSTSLLYLPAELRHAITEKIQTIFPTDTSPFMMALLVGDTAGLREDTVLSGALSATGTSHIISVSGMNVAFLMSLLGFLIKDKRRLALWGIPVVVVFMAVVGFAPPVTRAGIMQIFLLSAPLFRRETDPVTSLSASLLLILLFNPFSAGSTGLQLSFTATLGMLLFSDKLYAILDRPFGKLKFYKHRPVRWFIRILIASLSSTVGALSLSLPLIALHFGTVSLIAPLTNIAVLWAVSLAFTGGIIAVAAAFIVAPAGAAVAFVVALPARFVIDAITALSHVPFASVYTANPAVVIWLVYAYLMLAAYLAFRVELRRYVLPACASAIALCLILLLTSSLSDRQNLSVTALDVGQGQCVVITTGRFTEVVDCGSKSGKDAGDILTKYLQGHGRTTIDLLVLTHYHEDHANGVAEVLARNRVSMLAVPVPSLDDGPLSQEILEYAESNGITIYYIAQDVRAAFGGLSVCLYAPLGTETENERGLTILCSDNGFDALITGDMSDDIEQLLVSEKSLPDIEVLIAGHHGSKYASSDALLRAVTPEAAVISVGFNTYGHPAPETLRRLAQYGITAYRTDLDGDVTIHAP